MGEQSELERDEPQEEERWQVLLQLEEWLERPMLFLSFLWLSLVLVELVWATSGVFELLGTIIWIVFVVEFILRFALAPRKWSFVRRNPITIIALIAPALRFLYALRFLRLALLLSLYGLAIFGYITASFATFLIGREAQADDGDVAGSAELAALRREIVLLRSELRGETPAD